MCVCGNILQGVSIICVCGAIIFHEVHDQRVKFDDSYTATKQISDCCQILPSQPHNHNEPTGNFYGSSGITLPDSTSASIVSNFRKTDITDIRVDDDRYIVSLTLNRFRFIIDSL